MEQWWSHLQTPVEADAPAPAARRQKSKPKANAAAAAPASAPEAAPEAPSAKLKKKALRLSRGRKPQAPAAGDKPPDNEAASAS